MKRILIAGVGNIFHGDDAFGVEVIRALSTRPLPEQVVVEDFGIRSYDLAYALTDSYDAVILVDAMPRGRPPGTVSLVEPDTARPSGVSGAELVGARSTASLSPCDNRDAVERVPTALAETLNEALDPHAMNLDAVLRMAQTLGGVNGRLYLVGCEPAVLECDGGKLGLSRHVASAVPIAVGMLESLVARLLDETQHVTAGCVPA